MGRVYLPHSEPLACWKEDPLGAIALFVTGFLLIATTGIATFL
jgi:hypothetical protein